jgi:hypothetical protein
MNTDVKRENARKTLREMIPQGSTIYILLRHRNEKGTRRWLEFYHIHDGNLKRITWDVALAIQGEYCRGRDALKIEGTGLDVGYESVDTLSGALFGTGRALKHQWL